MKNLSLLVPIVAAVSFGSVKVAAAPVFAPAARPVVVGTPRATVPAYRPAPSARAPSRAAQPAPSPASRPADSSLLPVWLNAWIGYQAIQSITEEECSPEPGEACE